MFFPLVSLAYSPTHLLSPHQISSHHLPLPTLDPLSSPPPSILSPQMTPPIKELLPRLTPVLKNRHEKVQENCIDLVGRIADRGASFVPAREWMRICFELLEMLKAHKKAIRRATVNTFGYIAKAIGPQVRAGPPSTARTSSSPSHCAPFRALLTHHPSLHPSIQDVLVTLLNNLKVQERQNRVCTTVAIAIVAETCAPFTVLPALMNEYRVPELNVQNGVLKALSFMFEYIGEMGKDYIYAVAPLLEDALMDRDLVGLGGKPCVCVGVWVWVDVCVGEEAGESWGVGAVMSRACLAASSHIFLFKRPLILIHRSPLPTALHSDPPADRRRRGAAHFSRRDRPGLRGCAGALAQLRLAKHLRGQPARRQRRHGRHRRLQAGDRTLPHLELHSPGEDAYFTCAARGMMSVARMPTCSLDVLCRASTAASLPVPSVCLCRAYGTRPARSGRPTGRSSTTCTSEHKTPWWPSTPPWRMTTRTRTPGTSST